MARLPRYFVKGVPLHIILRGNNRAPIFGNDDDYQFFKECLLDAAKRHGLTIHAEPQGQTTIILYRVLLRLGASSHSAASWLGLGAPGKAI
jgi:hypothetical protein